MVKVIFLGTNGWYDTLTGNTVSTLVKTRDYNIVLDAGNGIAKLSRYMDDNKPTYSLSAIFTSTMSKGCIRSVRIYFLKASMPGCQTFQCTMAH